MGTITVSHLGKAYKKYPSRWLGWPNGSVHFHQPSPPACTGVFAKDIDFTVKSRRRRGGIIGINRAAGKSTLLQRCLTGLPTSPHPLAELHITGRRWAMP